MESRISSKLIAGLLLAAAAVSVHAQVEMRSIGTCATNWDELNPQYTNNTSFDIDMKGFGITVAGTRVAGQLNPGGTTVAPGATAIHNRPACGGTGIPVRHQMESRMGTCNELRPPNPPDALQCDENLLSKVNRDANRCVQDGLGVGRGDGYGGIVDSWLGETQLQIRIPTQSWTRVQPNGTSQTVRFDPAASMGGPMYLMSVAAVQEFMYVDMQFLLALGASKTGAGLVDAAAGTTMYVSPPNQGTDQQAIYTSFGINLVTLQKIGNAYPKFTHPMNQINSMVSAGGTSGGLTPGNGPQQASSAMLGALNLWWYLDATQQATNLCFRQYVRTATDKSAGLKVLLSGYENGPGISTGTQDFATQVLPAVPGSPALTAADVTSQMKPYQWGAGTTDFGTTNYVTRVFDALRIISNAGNTCGSAPIYDSPITRTQIRELFFGVGGTVATQGPGGLLWHLKIPAGQRQSLWTGLDCAFDRLKGSAPSSPGAENISFRYDFLPILRVARTHLAGFLDKFDSKPTEAFGEYAGWVSRHSNAPCQAAIPDNTWPTLVTAADTMGLGQSVEGAGTSDNKGIRDREYTRDSKWLTWLPTTSAFQVPADMRTGERLWYRISDSCGNVTTQEIKWRDMPQLPKPIASPGDGATFNGSITVTLQMPPGVTADIYYTVNGTTTKYPGTQIILTGSSDITLTAIARNPGFRDSDPLVVVYKWVAIPPSKQPVLTPPNRNFSDLDPDFTVNIKPADGSATGTVILYTTDGNDPDTVVTGRTRQFTADIPVTGTLTIKAIAKEPGKLPSPVSTGVYTERRADPVATPVANPGATNFQQGPLRVEISTTTAGADIFYSLNGGPATPYAGPLSLTGTTTVKAWATKAGLRPSDTLTAVYTYTPPVGVKKAWYQDKNGDGRIETVNIEYDKPLPNAPARLAFNIVDDRGVSETRNAGPAEIQASGTMATITLSNPFGFGITSMTNSGSSGQHFKQDNIPLLDGTFAIDDSVAPVIVKADVFEPDSTRPLKELLITYSEKVVFNPSAQDAIVFKRENAEMPAGAVKFLNSARSEGVTGWRFFIDSTSTLFPIVKDSVAINNNGGTTDNLKNAPGRKLYRELEGNPPTAKPSRVYVHFPNGSYEVPRGSAVEPTTTADVAFIPVGSNALALSGNRADGKCQGCPVGGEGNFVGPIIYMEIPGACEYEFTIFSNVGELVVRGKGRIDDEDLKSLTPIGNGTMYRARIIWTGRTVKEAKAGTGAYVLQAVTKTARNLRTGAPPATNTHRIKFGLLRNYRGS